MVSELVVSVTPVVVESLVGFVPLADTDPIDERSLSNIFRSVVSEPAVAVAPTVPVLPADALKSGSAELLAVLVALLTVAALELSVAEVNAARRVANSDCEPELPPWL